MIVSSTLNDEMTETALRVREHAIRMSANGGCFLGASLSCVDLLVYLYDQFLQVDLETLDDQDRDYLLLSKGHDVPALYGLFAEKGWINISRLQSHLSVQDHIYWHPNRHIPGIEFHAGSLGHLVSVGAGIAMDCKLRQSLNRVVVVTGDGELNEGSVWESLLVAAAHHLDNLWIVVDRNKFQANMKTEELIPLEPLEDKFAAFGCTVATVNGHDFESLAEGFDVLDTPTTGPKVVIAHTVRGKGLPSIEARADRWFCNFTKDEVEALVGELHNEGEAAIMSESIVAR